MKLFKALSNFRAKCHFIEIGITITTPGITGLNTTTGTVLSVSQVGTSFSITGTTINTLFGTSITSLSTTITFIGRDSGARVTVPLIIQKVSTI